MENRMRALPVWLALAFPLNAVCSENLEFAVVSGVESLQRVRTGSSLFPWDHEAPGEVIVSLSCGFAQVEYARVTTPGLARLNDDLNRKPWKVLALLGHYCKLSEFVLEDLHLIAYRKWKGKDYLINLADILVGEDKRLYVDDSDFIEHTGLESLAGAEAEKSGSPDCVDPGPECAHRRIYLDAIPMQVYN